LNIENVDEKFTIENVENYIEVSKNKKKPTCLSEAFDEDDFFLFRSFLRKTSCHGVFIKPKPTIELKKTTNLFDSLPNDESKMSLFEKILSWDKNCVKTIAKTDEESLEEAEKSAKYISLIYEEFQLWNYESLVKTGLSDTKKVPMFWVAEAKNVKNFFSYLVFDWHNPDRHASNTDKKYYLELKNKQMIETTGISLFQKLYQIINDLKYYHEVCLRIIYEYLKEMDERILREKKIKAKPMEKDYDENVGKLVSIEDVFDITKPEYKTKVLEILVTYWDILKIDIAKQKAKIFEATNSDENDIENPTFFILAFQLIERKHHLFENGFSNYVDSCKRTFGHYDQTIVKPVARLLLSIARQQKMYQVESFIFHKCHYLEINSSPLTNFQEFYKFNNINIFRFAESEVWIYVRLKLL
jgi:hypothetical protein